MLPSHTYSQPQAADPVLEAGTVLALLRRHGAHGTTVSSIDETGGEARVYKVAPHFVLKIQRPHRLRPRTSLAKEAFFLTQLPASPDIVVPQVLGCDRHNEVEYLVMTQMPGVPARTVTLTGAPRTALLRQLGRTLRRLHTLPQAPFAASSLFPGPRTRAAFVAQVQENLAQAISVLEATPDLWPFDHAPADLASQFLAGLPDTLDLVALHSNPGPEHVFVRPDTFTLVGLIDFGDAYIGHPALDWRWPTHADRLDLLHGYGADTPLSQEFLAAWRAVLGLSDIIALATRPESRPQTLERLRDLLPTLA